MSQSVKQQLDEIEVQILSLQRQLRASMDRFQALYTQVSGSEATTEGYKVAAQAAQAGAQAAQAGAQAAQAGAQAAQARAQAAQTRAQAAQAGAEAARDEMLGVADTKVDKPTENLPPGQADLRVGAVNRNGQLVVTGVDPAHMFHSGGMDSAWLQTLLAWSGDPGVLLNTGIPYQSIVQKPTGAVTGNLPTFGAGQALVDSGVLATSVSTAITQAAGAVRHDTAQALSSAAKDQANANIATGFKPSLLATYDAKALMRAALVESGQAQRLIMLSSTYVAYLQIPTGATEPTLRGPITTVAGNAGVQYSGANTHHALYKFTYVFGNTGTPGAGVGTLRIGGYLHTTAQIPCVFADGEFSALTLTLADSSTIVIRTATASNGREYIWLKTAYGNGSTRPVYIYDYATNEWKLLVTLQTTSTAFYPLSFGFVLGTGYTNCKVYHDNINGSIVYPGTINISDIF